MQLTALRQAAACVSLITAMLLCGLSPVFAEKRVALVIGNAAYTAAGRLANPVNDARDVAKALRALAFDVDLAEDLDLREFESRVQAFSARAKGADVALLYYSGHGMGLGSETYLLPTDADFKSEFEVPRRAIGLSDWLGLLKGQTGMVLAFIDACRNNPLAERLASTGRAQGRSVAVTRGLAPIDTTNPETLIVYATTPGRTADDGSSRNSPFTEAFLAHIRAPVEVEAMLKRVSLHVKAATGNKQEPERLSRLTKEFYFNHAASAAIAPNVSSIPWEARQVEEARKAQTQGIGEPRKVKTISVRPDGTIYTNN